MVQTSQNIISSEDEFTVKQLQSIVRNEFCKQESADNTNGKFASAV